MIRIACAFAFVIAYWILTLGSLSILIYLVLRLFLW